jgi:hypothetical protein
MHFRPSYAILPELSALTLCAVAIFYAGASAHAQSDWKPRWEKVLAQEVIAVGAPVHPIGSLAEGSALATGFGGVGLANRAPHPNAATVYINWLLTREGQTLLARGLAYASRRQDAPTDHLPAFMIPRPKQTYFEADHEETLKLRASALALAKEVFGQ